jgi:hypothetical protein
MTQKSDREEEQYIPGNCNLGKAEIRRRYRIGYIGLALTILIVLLLFYTDAPRIWRLLIFFPAFYGVSGFIQATKKFCYIYGFRQVFSLEGIKSFTKIKNDDFVKADQRMAMKIVVAVFVMSVVITLLYYIL